MGRPGTFYHINVYLSRQKGGRGPTSEVWGLVLQCQSVCWSSKYFEASKLPLVVQDEERMPETCSFVCGHVGSSPPPPSTSVDIDITHVDK